MSQSLLSGGIGIPEGGFARLSNKQAESALEFIIQNQLSLNEIIVQGAVGGVKDWIRFNAAGTRLAGKGLTVSRTAEGTYLVTADQAYPSSGGFFQYGVLTNPSTVSGNGGDGVSPFLAYDSNTARTTGTTGAQDFFREATTDDIFLLDTTDDKVYIHDLDNFTTAPTEVAATIETAGQSGCLTQDGTYLWISGSGAAGGSPTKTLKTSDNSVLDFGGTINRRCLASNTTYLLTAEGSTMYRYTPNYSTPALGTGTSVATLNFVVGNGCWDGDGHFWQGLSGGTTIMTQVNMSTPSSTVHNKAGALTAPASPFDSVTSSLQYDQNRRCIYVGIKNNAATLAAVFKYQGWTNGVVDSGVWTKMFDTGTANTCVGLYYDAASDIILVGDTDNFTLSRWHAESLVKIDTVSCKDLTSPDNPQVDYTITASRQLYYDGVNNYAYFVGQNSTPQYLVRVSYNGDELEFGGGGSVVSSALISQYNIISATQAYVYLFRSLSPIVRADGEATVGFVSSPV